MVIPTQQQAYALGTGTSPIQAFKFSESDPPPSYNGALPLYQGWVNTLTKAIWYLEGSIYANGAYQLQWRAVAPVVVSSGAPSSSDYLYPVGQTWVDSGSNTFGDWSLSLEPVRLGLT